MAHVFVEWDEFRFCTAFYELHFWHARSARGLDQFYGQIENLAAASNVLEMRFELTPAHVAGMNNLGRTIDSQDHGIAIKSAEHKGHARDIEQMCRGFIAAAAQIQPDDALLVHDHKGAHALGRHIHPTVSCRRCDKKTWTDAQ